MDSKKYYPIYICSLILCVFPSILYTQRITCPTPCDVGYTCAMVRHGSQPSAPGCITMEEAILLHTALNGGPSGPGSGITSQVATGIPQQNIGARFPQSPRRGDPIPPFPQASGGAIPGMNFLGSTDPQQPGFEQRFAQGLGRQAQSFGFGPTGQVNGQFGPPQGPMGMTGPAFVDPTTGQFAGPSPGQFPGPTGGQFGPTASQFGPSAGQFGSIGGQFGGPNPGQFGQDARQFGPGGPMGFNPRVDGGQNISSSSGIRDNTNLVWHDLSHGGGNSQRIGPSGQPAGFLKQMTNSIDQTSNQIGNLDQFPRSFDQRPGTLSPRQGSFGLRTTVDRSHQNANQPDTAGIEIPPIGFIPQVVDLSIQTPPLTSNRGFPNEIRNEFSHVSKEEGDSQFNGIGQPASLQPHFNGEQSHISRETSNNEFSNNFPHEQRNGFLGEQRNTDLMFNSHLNHNLVNTDIQSIPDGFVGQDSSQTKFEAFDNTPPRLGLRNRAGIPNQTPLGTRVGSIEPETIVNNAPVLINLEGIKTASVGENSAVQSKVSSIREDSAGLHYVFYPRINGGGFRVNITKDGFCPRDPMTRENLKCTNNCYSDEKCPLEQKCCPSGCSLRCRKPHIPVQALDTHPQGIQSNNIPACVNRNPWCPVGYICQRQPTETPGQLEDRCVLQQRRQVPVGSGRSLPEAISSPINVLETTLSSIHSNIPRSNRYEPEPQIPSTWIPQFIGNSENARSIARTAPLDEIVREQSLEARNGIRPGLMKKNGIQRQPLTTNHSLDNTLGAITRNQDTRRVSSANSPFRDLKSMITRHNNTVHIPHTTQECKPCTKHSDCNDIFTYCINKTPCVGKVCFKVT